MEGQVALLWELGHFLRMDHLDLVGRDWSRTNIAGIEKPICCIWRHQSGLGSLTPLTPLHTKVSMTRSPGQSGVLAKMVCQIPTIQKQKFVHYRRKLCWSLCAPAGRTHASIQQKREVVQFERNCSRESSFRVFHRLQFEG
uniref:Uncharacterized protein n=1 Tax=Salix viminalis TaxID=40686 RepID=A0A6N2MH44_SALVM